MTNRELRIWNDLRPFSVGFENIFDHFNLHLDTQRTVNYPPYNINKAEWDKFVVDNYSNAAKKAEEALKAL